MPPDWHARAWYIIGFLACFCPVLALPAICVGGAIEYRKASKCQPSILHSGMAAILFGTFYLTDFFLTDLMSGKNSLQVLGPVFGASVPCGILLIALYAVLSRRIRRTLRCRMLVLDAHITDMESVREILGLPLWKAEKLMQHAIDLGLIPGAHIDPEHHEVILDHSPWARQLVRCPSCGASQTVNLGQALVCVQCGGALKSHTFRPGLSQGKQ